MHPTFTEKILRTLDGSKAVGLDTINANILTLSAPYVSHSITFVVV